MKSQLLPANCLRVFDHLVGLALKGLSLIHYHHKHMVRHDNSSIRNKDVTENLLLLNLFFPNAPFSNPLKTSETLTVFWCFQGVEKGCIGKKWVNSLYKSSIPSTHFRSMTFFCPPLKISECSFSMPLENIKSLVTYRSIRVSLIKVSFIKVAYQSIGLMSTILADIEP